MVPPPPAEAPEPAAKKELPGQGNKKEKKPDTPADPKDTNKEGFNSRKAMERTTQDKIDAVQNASEATKRQREEEATYVRENKESIDEATKAADARKLAYREYYDNQRVNNVPKSRDDLSWADHTIKNLA